MKNQNNGAKITIFIQKASFFEKYLKKLLTDEKIFASLLKIK